MKSGVWELAVGSLEILILPAKREDPFWKSTDKLLNDEEVIFLYYKIQTGVKAIVTKYGDIIGDQRIPSFFRVRKVH